jgi:hypothetical protein
MNLDLVGEEEAVLLPERNTLAALTLNLPINIAIATPVALAIAINAATINGHAAAVALNGVTLF